MNRIDHHPRILFWRRVYFYTGLIATACLSALAISTAISTHEWKGPLAVGVAYNAFVWWMYFKR